MSLEMFDKEIFDLTNKELERQCEGLEMIASENFTLPEVMEVMGSILTNKYAEGYPGKRYYGGCEFVDEIETLAIERCKKLFNCKFANVQPNSGSQANQGVYVALINPGDKILGMDLSHGGHLTHGAKVSSSGKMYESCFYGVELDGRIDYEKVREIAKKEKPKLIVCGASAYARVIDFVKFREIADEVGAYLFADIAHIAGLVVAGEHPSPFPHAHVVSSTTHKTLRGPRGGIIMTNDEELAKKINSAIFPGIQGGPLMHVIAAKAVGFKFNLSDEWKVYAKQVRTNAQVLANVLMDRKFKLVSDGTDNHLVLMSFLDREFSGKDADLALGNAGITANKNTVPGEIRSPFITSGLRLGTPALTARGFKEKEMEIVSNYIADILDDINNEKLQENIKQELKKLASSFIIYERAMF
ncbi:serine hydroxymethyltransferase [Campylobacter jejuni]|uniref:serine hydroxymethyltransferase n=1 Tax=Campylobacter TaxID=194 RepID=UPI0005CEB595|nr:MULTISPECIES: serine hydroxymethyltransferase [Campylobacter]EAI0803522.1 serine hydroxymethyltransferase [Campylobacter jejuni]EAK1851685.1 serine hydroxymethyltransferase [Campylobacter jejuni]ECO7058670.1 serine hydroxymethyltransferase [Campylobacter jejuni]EDP7298342.1 aminotransferase class I/II-fold pyridoxal phosphate-dependent enzyme [Campylobacter jejuni]KJD26379.1 serine hydroxymethyltransferase [Campylobacter jejuni subsp. jejuni]